VKKSVFLFLLLLLLIPFVKAEDMSTFSEVDPNNHIDYSASQVNFTSYSNEDAYLYRDYGAGYFVNFTHEIDAYWDSKSSISFQRSMIWLVANDLDDAKGLADDLKDFLGIAFAYTGGEYRLQLMECDGGALTYDYFVGALDTWYYFTISRFGTENITCWIYSDYARVNLVDTLNISSIINTNFRYCYAACTWNNEQNRNFYQVHENLTFVGLSTLTFYFITEGGQFRVNCLSLANGTSSQYADGIVLELMAVPHNRSWFFMNFTWAGGYNETCLIYWAAKKKR